MEKSIAYGFVGYGKDFGFNPELTCEQCRSLRNNMVLGQGYPTLAPKELYTYLYCNT